MRGKGTHVSTSKGKLSQDEYFLLKYLHQSTISLTAKNIAQFVEWDIRRTTSTLSNLVGMDLVIESYSQARPDGEGGFFSNQEPFYNIPILFIDPIRVRASYVIAGHGSLTMLHDDIFREAGAGVLYPFRPVDRMDFDGVISVKENGKLGLNVVAKQSDLEQFRGKNIKVRIDIV